MRISPVNLIVMAHTLDVEGLDRERILKRCQLDPASLLNEDGEWVPAEHFADMVRVILTETADPAFGLIAGKSLALMRYSIMTPLALFSPDLRHIFEDVKHFTPLLFEEPEYTLIERDEEAQVLMHPWLLEHGCVRYRHDFLVTSILQMLRFGGMRDDELIAIEVPHECEPELSHRYTALWGNKVRFGQRNCRVIFQRAALSRPMMSHSQVGYAGARERAAQALSARMNRIDTAEKVRQWLLSALPQQPSMIETARQLNMSERTLRRNLADLQTSYQALVQECQFLKARSLLADEQLPIKQVAHCLGFHSVASFHRSFRRWTDTTPTLWREAQFKRP